MLETYFIIEKNLNTNAKFQSLMHNVETRPNLIIIDKIDVNSSMCGTCATSSLFEESIHFGKAVCAPYSLLFLVERSFPYLFDSTSNLQQIY